MSTSPRQTFYAACPVCTHAASRPVVAFSELAYVQCQGCQLIYKSEQVPGLGVGYEEQYFKFNRAKYLARWAHRVRKCRRQVLACLEYAPHARTLLDVGCSAGYVLEAARSEGLTPTGLDLSQYAVNLCQERGYAAVRGSLSEMPLPDASFDIVTLKHTLEHVEDPLAALREVHRVLRPGGVAFIVVPDAHYYKLALMPRRGRSFRPDRRGWQHHVYFDTQNLALAAQKTGFEPALAGKALHRTRLVQGPGSAAWEALRYGWLLAWTGTTRVTRTRREIQLIARKPHAAAPALAASSAA